jgi:hypothetical protein
MRLIPHKLFARLSLITGLLVLSSCGNSGGTGGNGGGGGSTATYRVEFSGSINAGSSFQGGYGTSSGQTEIFAKTLPASKEFSAGANVFVLGDASVVGSGGNVTVKVFKNNVLCEEKSLVVTASGQVSASCNKP